MNVNWFLGFSEGEGNFSFTFKKRKHPDAHYLYPKAGFQLAQSERKVLDEVKKFLDEQGIKAGVYRSPTMRADSPTKYSSFKKIPKIKRDTCLLVVWEIESIKKMIELLDSLEWHSQKRSDFEKWKRCIAIVEENPHLHSHRKKSVTDWKQRVYDLLRTCHIAQNMNVKSRKWTSKYLIDFLKTNKPYKDFDFVKKLKVDGKLEENLRIIGCS